MLCDFYELTMGNGYFMSGMKDTVTYFDLFYRTVPDQGGFAIAAGLEQAVDYIRSLRFSGEDIDYLRGRAHFQRGLPRLPARLQVHGRRLGGAGGDARVPARAYRHGARPR